MKKEKRQKEIKFNPADYDYMDNMPLEGWIWEFIRRNSAYKRKKKPPTQRDSKYNVAKLSDVCSVKSISF